MSEGIHMRMRVSDYIADYMKQQGVKSAFMLSGGGMMHLIDALGKVKEITYYCNHHEQASAMAAEGYARQSGTIGLCYATSGPGATNTVTGIAGAWLDSVPCLFVTGQSNLKQTIQGSKIEGLRQFGTFEVDIVPIVKPITKYAAFIDSPESIKYHLEKAVYLAQEGRPGPVLLDIPLNIQAAFIDPDHLEGFEKPPALPYDLQEECSSLLDKIGSFKRPVILAGHGIRSAGAVVDFRELVTVLGLPVITTQLAKDILPYNNNLFIGHPGVKGDRAGNFAVQNADFILSIGCSLHTQTTGYELDTFAVNAYKVQVELDEAVMQRENISVNEKISSDVENFIQNLLKAALIKGYQNKHVTWNQTCIRWKEQYAVFKEPHDLGGSRVNFYEFAEVLSKLTEGNETILTDAGSAFYVMGQGFRVKGDQRYIVSGALGAMGYSLPASIGVAAVDPLKSVLCVTGDGSLQTNIQELQTIRHHNLNIKLFIINNDGYASIRNTQDNFFEGHYVGSGIDSGVSAPSFRKIAAAYNIPYVECNDRKNLDANINEALKQTGPVICEIMCQPKQQIIPTVSSKKLDDGTMVSMPIHDMFPFLSKEELEANMLN
ncbi:thiamine pyrophosphate-binding protein [Paenibacillus silagei]|uniref:Acetolactate synthase-1/2/3 large subunit n=1 Tax=Paenibacillus silagei TaxID=1670801 RepID=A0ABS4NQS4_9BACL|nr:thiamine pyrophosphate-binding protein [Paenibacillus silagei]MBP2111672.1 acetolactate synthase-1/2/3 large subunit [Paenibacillus silagei]